MVYLLYGEDTFSSRQKLNEIIDQYKKVHKSGINLYRIDLKTSDFEDFRDQAKSTSMFKEKKLMILDNISSNQNFIEKFLENFKNFSESQDNIIVIFEEKQIDTKNALHKLLKKDTKAQEFNPLEGVKLRNWIKKEFEKYAVKIDPQMAQFLAYNTGGNLWELSNEIKKISAYVSKKREVREEDINLLVNSKLESNIFKTIDAIAQRNKREALYFLHKHLEKGESPIFLLAMINMQFRNIIQIKDLIDKGKSYAAVLKETKLNPFVVKKGYFLAQSFMMPELKKIYQKMFQVDLNIKTGKINPEIALDNLIIGL